MTDAFAGTLHLAVRASAGHRWWVCSVHGVALAVVAVLAVHRPWFALLLPAVLVVAVRAWRRAGLQRFDSIVRLRWQADGVWRWQTRDGDWHEGECVSAFVCATVLVIVTLRENRQRWRRRHCVLFHDGLDADGHRRLRARLTVMPPSVPSFDDA